MTSRYDNGACTCRYMYDTQNRYKVFTSIQCKPQQGKINTYIYIIANSSRIIIGSRCD